MKAMSLPIPNLWSMLKFFCAQKDKQTGQKLYAPIYPYRGKKKEQTCVKITKMATCPHCIYCPCDSEQLFQRSKIFRS